MDNGNFAGTFEGKLEGLLRQGWKSVSLAAVIAAALAGYAGIATADETSDAYQKYYEAIEVQALCEDKAPDKATQEKVAAYITDQNKFSMTAGQSLMAIEAAKGQAKDMVKSAGCEDRSVQQLLSLYHATEGAATQ